MRVKIYAVISFIIYCFSVLFFECYAIEYYAKDAEEYDVLSTLFSMLYPILGAVVLSSLIWMIKRNSYWTKLVWSVVFLSLAFLVVNVFVTYLMHWSINK